MTLSPQKFIRFLYIALVFNSAFALAFGFSGRYGWNGRDGSSGASGEDIVIRASGAFQSFNLSGGDGSRGYPGEDGEHASSCWFSGKPERNMYGADGGDAGDGGNGGRGGSGGDATIFFSSFDELKDSDCFRWRRRCLRCIRRSPG